MGVLTEILRNLKSVRRLQEIYVGVKDHSLRHIVGLQHLLRSIEFDNNWIYLGRDAFGKHLPVTDIGSQFLDGHKSFLYCALTQSGFGKRIVHVKLRNLKDAGRVWSLPQVWAAFDHPALKELSIMDAAHVTSEPTAEAASSLSVEELRLAGCKNFRECVVDTETFFLLHQTSFPQLTKVDLRNYTVSEEHLVAFLQHISKTVRSVILAYFQVSSGTWSAVFETLREFAALEELNMKWLIEARVQSSTDHPEVGEAGPEWKKCVRAKGRERVQEYLAALIEGYTHLGNVHESIVLTDDRYWVGLPGRNDGSVHHGAW